LKNSASYAPPSKPLQVNGNWELSKEGLLEGEVVSWSAWHAISSAISLATNAIFYVDFDSLAYVKLLIRMIRRAGRHGAGALVTFAEMLPIGEQI
jgi:hypothetical protein